ncbi:MAG: RNA-binding S4 domain-containing protein [Mucilaginibacter polytrichastri]|nr:RNA-binding S4 domain-containing protein [Mucilaginibacter polytrichastri]
MADKEKLRIDKYLWAIRIFKTRTLATEACKAGRVKKDGTNLKASHEVKIGETYQVSKGPERKVVRVTGLLEKRVDAKTAVLHYEDLSPVEDKVSHQSVFLAPTLRRDRGTGRPTKKERRDMDDLFQGDAPEEDDE